MTTPEPPAAADAAPTVRSPISRFLDRLGGMLFGPGPEAAARVVDLGGVGAMDMFSRWENRMIFMGGADPSDGEATRGNGRLTVPTRRLSANTTYRFDGDLVVEGTPPAGTRFEVGGHATIRGDLPAGVAVVARMPEAIRHVPVTNHVMMHIDPDHPTLVPVSETRHEVTGLLYPRDDRPAVTVDGTIRSGATVQSNAGVAARVIEPGATVDPGPWGRGIALSSDPKVEITSLPVPLTPEAKAAIRPGSQW